MKILALETATDACSVALLSDHDIHQQYEVAPRAHTRLILPMLEKVLAIGQTCLAEIDAIAFSSGPGAFTGLRIAAGVTQGLAFSVDKPVIAISTLATLAQQILDTVPDKVDKNTVLLAGLDARMQEVYWGQYQSQQGSNPLLVDKEYVLKPQDVPRPQNSKTIAIGSAWQVYAKVLQQRLSGIELEIIDNAYPQARHVAQLAVSAFEKGQFCPAEQAQPVYLRDNVAKKRVLLND